MVSQHTRIIDKTIYLAPFLYHIIDQFLGEGLIEHIAWKAGGFVTSPLQFLARLF